MVAPAFSVWDESGGTRCYAIRHGVICLAGFGEDLPFLEPGKIWTEKLLDGLVRRRAVYPSCPDLRAFGGSTTSVAGQLVCDIR